MWILLRLTKTSCLLRCNYGTAKYSKLFLFEGTLMRISRQQVKCNKFLHSFQSIYNSFTVLIWLVLKIELPRALSMTFFKIFTYSFYATSGWNVKITVFLTLFLAWNYRKFYVSTLFLQIVKAFLIWITVPGNGVIST